MSASDDYPPLWATWSMPTKMRALDEIDRLRAEIDHPHSSPVTQGGET